MLTEETITTPDEIPNEMYEIENLSPGITIGLDKNLLSVTEQRSSRSRGIEFNNESTVTQSSTLLIIIIITGGLLLFICMLTCVIAKVKKKNYKTITISKKDVECCTINRPLLSMCEQKDSTSSSCCQN